MADPTSMTRDELNTHAEGLGFPNPADHPGTKAELVSALEAFQADGTVPEAPAPDNEESSDGEDAPATPEISDTFLQEVHAYLADPANVRAPAAVINFGDATPIRPVQE